MRRRLGPHALFVLVAAGLCACGKRCGGDQATPAGDAAEAARSPADAGAGDAGYSTLLFDPSGNGSPDALYWDDAKQILYIADDHENQVWTYTDAAGFRKYATVPDDPALDAEGHAKLNGLTELADGTLVVTRFGYGKGGALYVVSPDGGTAAVPNVAPARKRIAVTYDPAKGVVYSASFAGGGGAPASGDVETVDPKTGTRVYAAGFGKAVGLLVRGTTLLVSDQTNDAILAIPLDRHDLADGGTTLADGAAFPVYAAVPAPDQLTAGPNGTIFTDQFQSHDAGPSRIRQIWPDGGVTIPWPDVPFTSPSDVAYDATNHRLFVADGNGSNVRTIKVLPVSR